MWLSTTTHPHTARYMRGRESAQVAPNYPQIRGMLSPVPRPPTPAKRLAQAKHKGASMEQCRGFVSESLAQETAEA
jgi:hypothetical protein